MTLAVCDALHRGMKKNPGGEHERQPGKLCRARSHRAQPVTFYAPTFLAFAAIAVLIVTK